MGEKQIFKTDFYKDELQQIKQNNIKIHAFYVKTDTEDKLNEAKENFNEIAAETKGNCEFLDLNDIQKGAEKLTNLVTIEILRIIDENLAQVYEKNYLGHIG